MARPPSTWLLPLPLDPSRLRGVTRNAIKLRATLEDLRAQAGQAPLSPSHGDPEATPNPDPVPPADKGKPVPSPPEAKPKPSKPTWNPSEDFLKKDKDKNFKLTRAEFVTIKKGPQKTEQEQLFKKLDRDGNGHLTLSEFKNRNGIKGQ